LIKYVLNFAKDFLVFFLIKIKTMKTETNHHQIVIKTTMDDDHQKLPVNILIYLAAGAITGVALIFGLIAGLEFIFSL